MKALGAATDDNGAMTDSTPLEQLAKQTGRDFRSLINARATSAERTRIRREMLAGLPSDRHVSVVMVGSWGRAEVTSGSDDDLVILVDGGERGDVKPQIGEIVKRINAGDHFKAPGPEGTFAETVFSRALIDKIGLDRDKNSNLTRRMLLLLESVALTDIETHARVRREILAGYLDDTIKDFRPPRFLLNDLTRYWRTIGVDFVAKVRERDGQGWGLRNAKLRTSRKLLFASGLLAVLRCHEVRREDMLDFLEEQFRMPPSDRIASAFLHYHDLDHGAAALVAHDQFLQLLDDDTVRAELDAINSAAAAAQSQHFEAVARLGVALDQALLGLLFGPALARWTRDFAIL
jgi:hypothetical protein